ncbi:MAG: NUDIX domain-containing protein [Candidatus Staskawiczbacteria bacterium]|nr:NUDIX domain-containing protein [Candidatus Staskawiczbacteria bacterium]
MAKRVFTQTFGVAGAIIEKDRKILLVKEAPRKGIDAGKWNHPAGWIEVGESPIEAVKKEVEEETGYKFMPSYLIGVYSLDRQDFIRYGEEEHHPIKLIFTGSISEERNESLANDVTEARWFTPEEIYDMDSDILRDIDIKQIIKDYFAGKKYPLEIITHTIQK